MSTMTLMYWALTLLGGQSLERQAQIIYAGQLHATSQPWMLYQHQGKLLATRRAWPLGEDEDAQVLGAASGHHASAKVCSDGEGAGLLWWERSEEEATLFKARLDEHTQRWTLTSTPLPDLPVSQVEPLAGCADSVVLGASGKLWRWTASRLDMLQLPDQAKTPDPAEVWRYALLARVAPDTLFVGPPSQAALFEISVRQWRSVGLEVGLDSPAVDLGVVSRQGSRGRLWFMTRRGSLYEIGADEPAQRHHQGQAGSLSGLLSWRRGLVWGDELGCLMYWEPDQAAARCVHKAKGAIRHPLLSAPSWSEGSARSQLIAISQQELISLGPELSGVSLPLQRWPERPAFIWPSIQEQRLWLHLPSAQEQHRFAWSYSSQRLLAQPYERYWAGADALASSEVAAQLSAERDMSQDETPTFSNEDMGPELDHGDMPAAQHDSGPGRDEDQGDLIKIKPRVMPAPGGCQQAPQAPGLPLGTSLVMLLWCAGHALRRRIKA